MYGPRTCSRKDYMWSLKSQIASSIMFYYSAALLQQLLRLLFITIIFISYARYYVKLSYIFVVYFCVLFSNLSPPVKRNGSFFATNKLIVPFFYIHECTCTWKFCVHELYTWQYRDARKMMFFFCQFLFSIKRIISTKMCFQKKISDFF